MKRYAKSLVCALGLLGAVAANAATPEDILKASSCLACHNVEKKMVGPSFKTIAAKYKGQNAAADVRAKVRAGGKGVFGPIPMPANGPEKISDADLVTVVDYILKL